MRKSMVILLLAWWLVAPAWGAELPREVRDALPAAAEEITEELEDPASLSEGLSRLWDRALGYVEEAVRQSIGGGVVLLAAAVLCALTEECMDAAGGKVHFVPMAGALAITLAAAGSVKTMMGLGQETVEELNTFSKALLPTLSAAVAATGGCCCRWCISMWPRRRRTPCCRGGGWRGSAGPSARAPCGC